MKMETCNDNETEWEYKSEAVKAAGLALIDKLAS